MKHIQDFSTPNAENSRNLLKLVDFDPFHAWTWTQHQGRGLGMMTIRPADAAEKIRDWLRLRHDIAHGHAKLTVVGVLEDVRQRAQRWLRSHRGADRQAAMNHLKNLPEYSPSLRLKDAESCVRTFRRLARLTALGLAAATGAGPANAW
ncbi:MAG: hypothetical protein IPI67_26870 [Myxococcales bacterium]|nr:hypothetical protein [Myxococcales bacterium]